MAKRKTGISRTPIRRTLRRSSVAFCLLIAGTLTVATLKGDAPPPEPPRPRLVLLPLDGEAEATSVMERLLVEAIARKGWQVVSGAEVRTELQTRRVRYLDSLDAMARAQLLDSFGATAYVSGSLLTYARGRDPIVALAARLIRADGSVAWSDVRSLSSLDTEGFFGAGRRTTAEAVGAETVDLLLRRFPQAGHDSVSVRAPSRSFLHSGPLAFRAADLDPRTPHLVCILPLENRTSSPDAGRVLSDLLTIRLAAAQGFEVVEPSTLRAAALKAGIASFRFVRPEDLVRLAAAVHTSLFLSGTVFEYVDPAVTPGREPHLELELTLVDVSSSRVLWSVHHDRKGSDYTGLFMLGAATSSITLADRMLGEMIETGTAGGPRRSRDATAARARLQQLEKHSELRGVRRGEEK